ncbi:MAG: hypothetical protein V4481_02600 [Patescibacteria group bacterium]
MSKRQWLILFGLWIIIFPFLGFPSEWNKIFAVATGILICFAAYRSNPDVSIGSGKEDHIPYVEHRSDTNITSTNQS